MLPSPPYSPPIVHLLRVPEYSTYSSTYSSAITHIAKFPDDHDAATSLVLDRFSDFGSVTAAKYRVFCHVHCGQNVIYIHFLLTKTFTICYSSTITISYYNNTLYSYYEYRCRPFIVVRVHDTSAFECQLVMISCSFADGACTMLHAQHHQPGWMWCQCNATTAWLRPM